MIVAIIMIIIFRLLNFIIMLFQGKSAKFVGIDWYTVVSNILNLMLIFKQALHVILYSEYVSFI